MSILWTIPGRRTPFIPELKYEDSDGDGIYELTSTADPIIPYIGGKPYYDCLLYTSRCV